MPETPVLPETPVMPETAAGHAAHDLLAIAAYAAGDATGDELCRASGLAASCTACAELHHDLRAIAHAMPLLPAPARPRDFRLTAGQAAALRPAGWRRVLAPFAGPRFAFAAPLGGALAALGLAGILVAGGTGGIVPMSSSTAGQPAAGLQAPAPGGGYEDSGGAEAPLVAPEATPGGVNSAAAPAAAAPASAAASEAPPAGTVTTDAPSEAPASEAPAGEAAASAAAGEAAVGAAASEAPKDAAGNPPAVAGAAAPSDAAAPQARVASPVRSPAPAPAPLPVVPIVSGFLLLAGLALLVLRTAGRRLARVR